jgi:hypothetical protein
VNEDQIIIEIYAQLSELFAQQRRSLLLATAADFKLKDKEEYDRRHARIVELYQQLGKLLPQTYWADLATFCDPTSTPEAA